MNHLVLIMCYVFHILGELSAKISMSMLLPLTSTWMCLIQLLILFGVLFSDGTSLDVNLKMSMKKHVSKKENGLHAQDLLTILSSTFNIIRRTHLIISWLGHFWLWKVTTTTTQEIKSLPYNYCWKSHITFADPRIPHSEIQAEDHGKQVWLAI